MIGQRFFQRGWNTLILSKRGVDNHGYKFSFSEETALNWGDALNWYLLPRITGRKITHYSQYFNLGWFPTLSTIGSVLDNNRVRRLWVWGSGFKSAAAEMPVIPERIFSVRGVKTREKLLKLGCACPEQYGDPALVLPLFYSPPSIKKKYRLGIIPHYVDENSRFLEPFKALEGVVIVSVRQPIESFVDQICSCDVIASSSLHGLIAADAYGIPRVWLSISDKIAGGQFKFLDHFSVTSHPELQPLELKGQSINEIESYAVNPRLLVSGHDLLKFFPFHQHR